MNECSSPVGTLQGTEPRRVKHGDVARGGQARGPLSWAVVDLVHHRTDNEGEGDKKCRCGGGG